MRTPSLLAFAALVCLAPAARAANKVALAPLELPDGERRLQETLQAAVRAGAEGVATVEPLGSKSCEADEGRCLAAAARVSQADSALSGEVAAAPRGYRFHLRSFAAADGALRAEEQGEVRGGPLDLAAAVEGAACKLLSGATCMGELTVRAADGLTAHLFVDELDRGPLPLEKSLTLPVGRHAVRVGKSEQRVHLSHGSSARLFADSRADSVALLTDEGPSSAPATAAAQGQSFATSATPLSLPEPTESGRSTATRLLFASGLGLIAAGAGVALFSKLDSQSPLRSPATALITPSPTDPGSSTSIASFAATALLASGAGALAVGGLVFALTPTGPALGGHF